MWQNTFTDSRNWDLSIWEGCYPVYHRVDMGCKGGYSPVSDRVYKPPDSSVIKISNFTWNRRTLLEEENTSWSSLCLRKVVLTDIHWIIRELGNTLVAKFHETDQSKCITQMPGTWKRLTIGMEKMIWAIKNGASLAWVSDELEEVKVWCQILPCFSMDFWLFPSSINWGLPLN